MRFPIASIRALLLLAVTAVGTVSAFVASLPSVVSSNTQVKLASDRVQEAIQAAQEASTNYGPTSPEARVAWDTVEELEASDNSAAYKKFDRPPDYEKKMEILNNLVKKFTPDDHSRQEKALEVKPVKFGQTDKRVSTQTAAAPETLKEAIARAKEMGEKHGKTSPEAAEAWDEVEEISAAIAHSSQAIPDLMRECWVELSEACDALEEVDRVLHLKQ